MDEHRCPHCRSGYLVVGTCTTCGWSTAFARPDRSRPPSRATFFATDPSPACWFQLPLAAVFINVIGPIVSQGGSELFVALTAGAVAAQFGLLAIVGALGPGRHAARLVSTFVVAAGLLMVLIVGIAFAEGGVPSGREVGGVFLVLPAVLLAAQAPLWLFRACTGKWLRAPAGTAAASRKAQFGVAQMMWATALIAVAVALARGALVLWGQESDPIPPPEWGRLTAVCGIVALASGLVAVPATAAVMIPRSPRGAVVLTLVYATMLTVAILGVITAFAGPAPAGFVAQFGLTSMAMFGGVLAGLGVIRNSGYSMAQDRS